MDDVYSKQPYGSRTSPLRAEMIEPMGVGNKLQEISVVLGM